MSATEQAMNIQALLDGISFPAEKTNIVAYAKDHGASGEALSMLEIMPDRSYNSMEELNKGLGLVEALPGQENIWVTKDE